MFISIVADLKGWFIEVKIPARLNEPSKASVYQNSNMGKYIYITKYIALNSYCAFRTLLGKHFECTVKPQTAPSAASCL